MASSDVDPDTEALIAQLMAEDLGESYHTHCAPIGASYHDYEEPLSSFERQCLDAENNPDDGIGQASGWGPEETDGVNEAAAPDEGLDSNGPPGEDKWDSRFVDDDGQVRDYTALEQSPQPGDEDDAHSDSNSCSNPTSEELIVSPARIASPRTDNVPTNPVGETPNISDSTIQPTDICPEPTRLPHNHIDTFEQPSIPSSHLKPNEQLPASSEWDVKDQWDDGLDYSSSKGKGKAVRAYDEFKRGLRNGERESRNPKVAAHSFRNKDQDANYDSDDEEDDQDDEEDDDDEDDDEEEGEIRDEDLPFIRIPWPRPEKDELLTRREDAAVVEIRVGDQETLESILNDIERWDERRSKGEVLLGAEDLAASWR